MQGEEHGSGRHLSLSVEDADGARGDGDEEGDQADHRRNTFRHLP